MLAPSKAPIGTAGGVEVADRQVRPRRCRSTKIPPSVPRATARRPCAVLVTVSVALPPEPNVGSSVPPVASPPATPGGTSQLAAAAASATTR